MHDRDSQVAVPMAAGPEVTVADSSDIAPVAELDICHFLAPLCAGKTIFAFGSYSQDIFATLYHAKAVAIHRGSETEPQKEICDFWICLDPQLGDRLLAQGVHMLATAGADVLLAIAASTAVAIDCAPHFPHMRHYIYRSLSGSLIGDARFPHSRVAALYDTIASGEHCDHLFIFSKTPLPALRGGIFEASDLQGRAFPSPTPSDDAIGKLPSAYSTQREREHRSMRRDAPGRAVALATRLLEVDERTFGLRSQIMGLERKLAQEYGASAMSQSYFDVPRTKHPWALADDQTQTPDVIGLYDRRVDDAVILEGRAGKAFLAKFALESDTPLFADCVAALNAVEPVPSLISADHEGDAPDVTVVIPVYGQLAYTLNCIDSLLRHATRYSMEILVIDDCSPDQSHVFLPQIQNIRYHRQPKNGGFINSCNTGGVLARGAFVIMLNNDTRVVENWLDALVDSFKLFPNAGLVGSKMLYPDGSLQEAGGILWRDGGAWNYGRNDDPNRPQYSYARQVDYISGCSLILPTPLWRQLKGFDPHYRPAYAEDADLCMRVAANGNEVWFQPQSRVVHYEGKTGGTDTGGGVKAYQVINLKKLFLRWRASFEHHRPNAEAPFLERERKVKKRFLLVDALVPTPNQDAGSLQTVLAARCCQRLGYKTHFVAEDNWLFVPHYTPAMQKEGVDCAYAPYDVGFENYIRRYGWSFDVVMVYRVSVLDRTIDLIRKYAPQAILIFHVADLHFLRTQRQAQLEGNAAGIKAAEALKEKEIGLVQRSDCTVTHSTVEAQILAEEAPGSAVTVWPLMIDFVGTHVGFAARRDICFLGGYRHPPNVDAVVHFVKEILPLVKTALPDIRFIIAGANPTSEVLELAGPDVIVTGLVDDLGEVFDKARVFVCPLRVGAGAKGKVMSALSHGLPIVSTPIGVEGAGLEDGVHVVVAETPVTFAQAIVSVYNDRVLWERLSANGMCLIQDEFSTTMGERPLTDAIDKAYHIKLGLD